jgi:release factor glutamine methyltransferase
MTISIGEAVREGTLELERAGISDARLQSSSLAAQVLGRDRSFVVTHADEPLESAILGTFRKLIELRAKHEPLQYLTGHQEFFKLDFEVTSDVLIPRPETELLVEASLELLRNSPAPVIADIGTGTGCIAISLLHELPNAKGIATDTSSAALGVARRNAKRHGVANRLSLIQSDCFSAAPRDQKFSLIVSNPPYVSEEEFQTLQPEVRDYEPRAALVSGRDGLSTIRRLLSEAPAFLRKDGYFVFEIGFGQSAAVTRLIDFEMWNCLAIRADLRGIPRAVVLKKN